MDFSAFDFRQFRVGFVIKWLLFCLDLNVENANVNLGSYFFNKNDLTLVNVKLSRLLKVYIFYFLEC